jgi:primosomal protein N' (replication factor Y)
MQRAVLDALRDGPVRVAELSADLGSIDGAISRLSEHGAIVIERRRRHRGGLARERSAPRHERLTAGQKESLETIAAACVSEGGVVLLDGVTGSGKTEVYLRAIESVRESGRSAIVLVPEISLTPQTVGRFRARFGDEVAVLHSRLSAGERYDQWDRIVRGEAHVVVVARSALFGPVHELGLVVIDEEHESSYKQSSSPRYHARSVAEKLCARTGAPLVLGSATPSIESRHLCDTGRWTRVVLPERVGTHPLPQVHVVDMTIEFEEGHRSMFSRPLLAALNGVRDRGEKAVLLLNRRGFASFLLCRECGFVPSCESCSSSLTYHEVDRRLACHHCGARRPVPPECPSCGSPYLRQFGAGTQRVEAELTTLLGDVPVVRMDADTTSGKGGHERALASFEAIGGAGVLLGTQMIAKGLDYPDVTLVGVINADTTMHLPDFRSSERTFQLLEQVAGRAGRGAKSGQVIIQTYWPDHPAVVCVASHDAEAFYTDEVEHRRELGFPPFGRLANVLAWGRDQSTVRAAAQAAASELRSTLLDRAVVLGPSPAPLAKLKGVHRWHVLIKASENDTLPSLVGTALVRVPRAEGVSIIADIDPLDLL